MGRLSTPPKKFALADYSPYYSMRNTLCHLCCAVVCKAIVRLSLSLYVRGPHHFGTTQWNANAARGAISGRSGTHPSSARGTSALFLLLNRYRYLDSRQLWQLLPAEVRAKLQPHRQRLHKKRKLHLCRDSRSSSGFRNSPAGAISPARSTANRRRGMRYLGHEIYELGEEALLSPRPPSNL